MQMLLQHSNQEDTTSFLSLMLRFMGSQTSTCFNTVASIDTLEKQTLLVSPPFIIVVQRSGNQVRVRSREL